MKEAARDGEEGRQVLEISFRGCLAFYEDMLATSLFASFLPSFQICLFAVLFASLFPGFFASVVDLVLGVLFAAFEALESDMETKMGSRGTEMEGSETKNLPKWTPWGGQKGSQGCQFALQRVLGEPVLPQSGPRGGHWGAKGS